MKTFDYTIKDELGIHARPAGQLAKTAKAYKSEITITRGDKSALCTKLLSLMSLGVRCGDRISVTVSGEDEEQAAEGIKAFLENNL